MKNAFLGHLATALSSRKSQDIDKNVSEFDLPNQTFKFIHLKEHLKYPIFIIT